MTTRAINHDRLSTIHTETQLFYHILNDVKDYALKSDNMLLSILLRDFTIKDDCLALFSIEKYKR
jgi:hypothetical protein